MDEEGKDTGEESQHSHDLPPNGDKYFYCPTCEKGFSKKDIFDSHLKSHGADRPHTCEHAHCGKTFRSAQSLAAHLRTHTGEKPYECDVCRKCFADASTLRQHKIVHSGERPYKCSFCGKMFNRSSIMRSHERLHNGARPFTCKHCGSLFSTNSTLTRHMQTHTGEKPHVCTTCGKAFSRYHHLVRHKNLHSHDAGCVPHHDMQAMLPVDPPMLVSGMASVPDLSSMNVRAYPAFTYATDVSMHGALAPRLDLHMDPPDSLHLSMVIDNIVGHHNSTH